MSSLEGQQFSHAQTPSVSKTLGVFPSRTAFWQSREHERPVAYAQTPSVFKTLGVCPSHLHQVAATSARPTHFLRKWRWCGGEPGSLEDLAAKSGPANDRPNMAHAYPRGTRHELMSLALLRSQSALLDRANDPHLVEHLVVSHHGWVRPFAPIQLDDRPETVAVVLDGLRLEARSDHGLDSVGSGLADNFWRLVERYGAYGLAYLEAILRTADQTHSGLEAAGHRIGKTIDLAATAQSAQPQEVNT